MIKVESVSDKCAPYWANATPHEVKIFDYDFFVTIVKDNVRCELKFTLMKGFKCDGASIPALFRWFLPSWDSDNFVYNLGSTVHDGLYANKGFGIFSREECDDILRGIWRESGIGRFKAGVADKCVEWFAGGKKHWGNDSYGVKDLFKMEIL